MDGKILTERQGLGNVAIKELGGGGNRGWIKTQAKEAKKKKKSSLILGMEVGMNFWKRS